MPPEMQEPPDGYNADGYNRYGYNQSGYNRRGYNRRGYDPDGYDPDGYDPDGFNRNGYTADGYDPEGYDQNGYSRRGYNRDGYNRDGYSILGYNADGYSILGYNADGYNSDGYDRYGFGRDGYSILGYNADGYNSDGYDRYGFGRDGYNANGYNIRGYNADGYDADGYNLYGRSADGYNRYGYDRDGFSRDGYDRYGHGRDGVDRDGYNQNGYNADGYDRYGYDRYGYNSAGYNADGYNADGYNADGYDRYGYDSAGYDRAGAPKANAEDLDLPGLWSGFSQATVGYTGYSWSLATRQREFTAYLRKIARNPDDTRDARFCSNCGHPEWADNLNETRGLGLCESCWEEWEDCDHCNERYPNTALTTLLDSETVVCESCRNSNCSYCDTCEGYYNDGDSDDHDHNCDCCESPQQAFTIRNNGCRPLANDTRTTVTLPAGVISPEGIRAISSLLTAVYRKTRVTGFYNLSCDLDALDNQWITSTGTYPKRLSSHGYKAHGVKLTPETMAQVGTIARDHSNAVGVCIEVTRNLNLSASDFGNGGSCWWGSYGESRCAFKTNGGFGLRSFSGGEVSGRAWVLPLRQRNDALHPTFDTMSPDAFVTFNGYGDLSGYAAPRIMSHLASWTYRKTGFCCSPMYVNGEAGYLIAPEPVITRYASKLYLEVSQHSHLFGTEQADREARQLLAEKEAAGQLTLLPDNTILNLEG